MSYGDDFNSAGGFSIYEVERKAMENITARAMNIPWPHCGVFSYSCDRRIKLGEIGFCGQSASLPIPPVGRLRLGNSLRMEVYMPCRHYYPAILALASAQGIRVTFPSSISRLRAATSASHADSASRSNGSSRLSSKEPAKAARASGGSRNACFRISAMFSFMA